MVRTPLACMHLSCWLERILAEKRRDVIRVRLWAEAQSYSTCPYTHPPLHRAGLERLAMNSYVSPRSRFSYYISNGDHLAPDSPKVIHQQGRRCHEGQQGNKGMCGLYGHLRLSSQSNMDCCSMYNLEGEQALLLDSCLTDYG